MHKRILFSVACIVGLLSLTPAWAADSAIGVAVADGAFRVNDAPVSGNATLFDGSVVEAGAASSTIRLNSGGTIAIAAGSRAKVLADRVVLESNMSDLTAKGSYKIEADSFRVEPATDDAVARVVREDGKVVQVAALQGSLRVFGAEGLQIANVYPGVALSFEPGQNDAAPPATHLGCLLKKEGEYILYDQTTRIIIELRGSQNFEGEVGNRVQVIGTTDTSATSPIAAQVVDVTSLNRYAAGGCEPVASAIGAEPVGQPATAGPATGQPSPQQTPTPAAEKRGVSAGTVVLVVAAIGGGGAAAAILATQGGNNRSR